MKLLPKEKIPAEEITSGSLDNSSSDTVRSLRPERKRDADGRDENGEYDVFERVILPDKIVCPDCGGITLQGLEFCDKCGAVLIQNDK
jgi:hypothetical protein